MARVLAGELGAAAGERVADTLGDRPRGLGAVASGVVTDAEVPGALANIGPNRRVGRGELAPGSIHGDDHAGIIEDRDVVGKGVEHGFGVWPFSVVASVG